jgi:hypothetical protein
MTKHKRYTRRRNKLHRVSRRKSTARRLKRNRRSASLIVRKKNGGRSLGYEVTDFFDPELDFAIERDVYTDFRNDTTQEEKNRIRVYSLLNNLNRRISRNPNNPRINVWNELVGSINIAMNDDNDAKIREFANQYNAARGVGVEQPDSHPMEIE